MACICACVQIDRERTQPAPSCDGHHPGLAAAWGASPPDTSSPLSPSRRCAALERINDEHRQEGYALTPRASIKKRAHRGLLNFYHRKVA
jgi:hypothetical protein